MAKGDTVSVWVRGVEGKAIDVIAQKAGRKLEIGFEKISNIQWLLVHEKTWTDKVVKTTRFNAADVMIVDTNFEVET